MARKGHSYRDSYSPSSGDPRPWSPLDEEIDESHWRRLKLLMPNPDGSEDVLDIELLRPLTWLAAMGAFEGGDVDLHLPEMGLRGEAHVISIDPCPTIEPGEGRVVLGTVTHLNARVMALRFVGSDVVLEPTRRHRLFSEDRGHWTPAGELKIGEHIRTAQGPVEIADIRSKPGIHRVYNLEIQTEHWYFVSELSVLSHNQNGCSANGADVTERPTGFRKKTVQDAWDNAAPGSRPDTRACPTCGKDVEVAPSQGRRDWDVDHQPPWSARDLSGKTRKDVLDDYNTGTRLECPGCNRSRGAKPAP